MSYLFRPLIFLLIFFYAAELQAQEILPRINVSSFNGKVVVSWLNDYDKPITDIFIQRSYDSTRNFTTIGSVLIPKNKENGFPDNHPPYDYMYYRVSIVFEGGSYIVGPAFKPQRILLNTESKDITDTLQKLTTGGIIGLDWQKENVETVIVKPTEIKKIDSQKVEKIEVTPPKVESQLNNTSNLVFLNRYNQVKIQLPDTMNHRYTIKFFDEKELLLFELHSIPTDGFVLEKYNFRKSGNYSFEIYEDGKLWRKNKFTVNKETRK